MALPQSQPATGYLFHIYKGPFGLRAKLPPVYYTRQMLHIVPLIAERQAGKLGIPIFIVFGLTRPGIESQSTASIADALSTQPLIGYVLNGFRLALIYAFFSKLVVNRLVEWENPHLETP